MPLERSVPLSVLDLASVVEGGTPAESFRRTMDMAQLAERLGYNRYWLAEHHNMPGIASSATSVVIGYVAGGTKTIRVGSGGIMLPNHAPLVIAEQFGTLESMYPGRIDLGLGRAPGSDQTTARALRRDLARCRGRTFPSCSPSCGHSSTRRPVNARSRDARRRPARADLAARLQRLQRAARRRSSACRSRSPAISRRIT